MHMNSVFARRTQSGRPVVHGIHTVLRSLEALAGSSRGLPLPSKLAVRFPAPVYVEDTIDIQQIESPDSQLRLQAKVEGVVAADLRLSMGSSERQPLTSTECAVDGQNACRELTLDDMVKCSGTVRMAKPFGDVHKEFPEASEWLGVHRIGALLCLSRLVGMECPGLHSLFSGFNIEFPRENVPHELQYRVVSLDKHYRLLKVDVSGLGVRGSVEAFARYPPTSQPRIQELSKLVKREDFAGHRVLIIGGSRGLGELTAKLIAAGGGHPTITYAVGGDDAERVAEEIKEWGSNCEVLKYDVRLPSAPQLRSLVGPISHLYYYATCQIFARKTRQFSEPLLNEFLEFYVRGFYNVCAALRELSEGNISVFYPSSVAVEERPRNMTEYAMAKAAAEILCADLNRSWPAMHVTTARLPRLLTDQTASVAAAESADSMSTILSIVRTVQTFGLQA